jgi:hypothetical protein
VSTMEKFYLIGSRLAEMHLDESVLLGQFDASPGDESVEAVVKVDAVPPEISEQKAENRSVIEIGIVVRMTFSEPSSAARKKTSLTREGFRLKFFAGFLAHDKKNDGNVEMFQADVPQYQRMLYWMKRDYILQVLSQSLYRSAAFPHDLEDDSAVEESKPPKRHRKTPAARG